MLDRDAFRIPGGARRVNYVRDIIRCSCDRGILVTVRSDDVPIAIDAKQRCSIAAVGCQLALCDHHAERSILNHELQSFARVFWIQRHITTTGLQHAENCDQHFETARHAYAHKRFQADTAVSQVMSQLVGARVQLGISDALSPKFRGDCVGCFCGLRFEQVMNTGLLWRLNAVIIPRD